MLPMAVERPNSHVYNQFQSHDRNDGHIYATASFPSTLGGDADADADKLSPISYTNSSPYLFSLTFPSIGALVLAHSLRDAQTSKRLACLVTLDSLSPGSLTKLKAVYDYVIPVPRIQNPNPANLYLMDRADLHSAFTKINLWRLTDFSKVVYVDADVVAYRAPDELFALPHAFAAAPDIGWPDLFNSGVMLLTPNMGDYFALMAMAERSISFDGADQGLLNMYFKNSFHRLSFTYNVTPSAHYQYLPAYRHFQSSITMAHFIGSIKPWFAGRDAPLQSGPFDDMVGRWWAVYDRHYRAQEDATLQTQGQMEFRFRQEKQGVLISGGGDASQSSYSPANMTALGITNLRQHDPSNPSAELASAVKFSYSSPPSYPSSFPVSTSASNRPGQQGPSFVLRDPTSQSSVGVVSTQGQPLQPKPLFPWESNRPKPSRTFAPDSRDTVTAGPPSQSPSRSHAQTRSTADSITTSTASALATTDFVPVPLSVPIDNSNEPGPPSWNSFQQTNAWDEIPQINRYVQGLQEHEQTETDIQLGLASKSSRSARRLPPLKLTDFPSSLDRPRLPVTPAPVSRSSFLPPGDDDEDEDSANGGPNDGNNNKKHNNGGKENLPKGSPAGNKKDGSKARRIVLPAAEGVPDQSDWDPDAQLKKLAERQHDVLLRKLKIADDAPQASPAAAASSITTTEPTTTMTMTTLPAAEDDAEDGADPDIESGKEGHVVSPEPGDGDLEE